MASGCKLHLNPFTGLCQFFLTIYESKEFEMTNLIENEVQIVGVRFQHESDHVRFESFPRRLVYKGREYTLVEA